LHHWRIFTKSTALVESIQAKKKPAPKPRLAVRLEGALQLCIKFDLEPKSSASTSSATPAHKHTKHTGSTGVGAP